MSKMMHPGYSESKTQFLDKHFSKTLLYLGQPRTVNAPV